MVVAIAMLGSLTVLPALLGKLGDRVEKGRIPFVHRLRRKDGESRFWGAILDRVLRRPVVSAVAAGAVLVALTVPAFPLNTATTGRRRHLDPRDRAAQEVRRRVPGRQRPGHRRDQGRRRPRRAGPGRDRRAQAAGARHRPDAGPDRGRGEPRQHRRESPSRSPATAPTRRRRRRSRPCARTSCPATVGQVDGVEYAVSGTTAAGQGLGSEDDEDGAARLRLRAPLRLPAPAGLVPLGRRRPEGDRAQPALGRSRLRRARRDLPVGLGREPARLRVERRHHARGCRCSCS